LIGLRRFFFFNVDGTQIERI